MTNKIHVTFDYGKMRNKQYVGQFGEQLVKMNFTINNIDTFQPLIDDKGIDFVARIDSETYLDIQTKTVRLVDKKDSYLFFLKNKWSNELRKNMFIAVVVLQQDLPPTMLLIPASAWKTHANKKFFADRNYEGKKSKPEWGLTINNKNLAYLNDNFNFEKSLMELINDNETASTDNKSADNK